MTQAQQEHLESLLLGFNTLASLKYERGVEEHGGNLWDKTPLELIEEAISENIDQFAYLLTARQKLLKQI